jgi:chromate reductase
MITVVNGTNRPGNKTQLIAKLYAQLLEAKGIEHMYFSLEALPQSILLTDIYDPAKNTFKQVVDKYILPSDKLVFVLPEYNGSYPGILKLFIDGCAPEIFRDKKVAFVGVASGRSGNIRGMDDLTNAFHYLGMHVLPFKVPVSSVLQLIRNNVFADENTLKALNKQVDLLINY